MTDEAFAAFRAEHNRLNNRHQNRTGVPLHESGTSIRTIADQLKLHLELAVVEGDLPSTTLAGALAGVVWAMVVQAQMVRVETGDEEAA
jgi:hypothetical protein